MHSGTVISDPTVYNTKGIYRVGQQVYTNKLEACLALNRLDDRHHLHWDYHEEAFDRHDWSVEPAASITDLYRARAQQIRDNYDHVTIMYSGGADSHTVLMSFLDNNIPVDEVFVHGAFKAEASRIQDLGWDQSPGYYTREHFLVAKPRLQALAKKHNFKVTVWDYTDLVIDRLDDWDWFSDIGTNPSPDSLMRDQLHTACGHNHYLEDRGRSVAFVWGVDKPRMLRDDHNVYFVFLDVQMTISAGSKALAWERDEYFYWGANFPLIPIKQSHLLYQYMKLHHRFDLIPHISLPARMSPDPEFNHITKLIVYPNWPIDTWQIQKPRRDVNDEYASWFFDTAPEKKIQRWHGGIKDMERLLGARHFNGGSVWNGLRGCYSKMYRIGPVTAPVDQ